MPLRKIGDLQIQSEAINPSPFFWRFQKVVLAILTVFLIAVLFGLAGPGFLDKKRIQTANGSVKVGYEFFARKNASQILEISIKSSSEKEIELSLNDSYLRDQYIKQVFPTPTRIENNGDHVIFYFAANSTENIITFLLEPEKAGHVSAEVNVKGEDPITFQQYFYP